MTDAAVTSRPAMPHRLGAQDRFGETIVIEDRIPAGYGEDAGATR